MSLYDSIFFRISHFSICLSRISKIFLLFCILHSAFCLSNSFNKSTRSLFCLRPFTFLFPRISKHFLFFIFHFAFCLSISAGLPQPMCVFYGRAKDEYGWPYTGGAEVQLKIGTNVYASHTVRGSISPGINFALYVHLDDGSDEDAYAHHALETGDIVDIVVVTSAGEQSILEAAQIPPVGSAGQIILFPITTGTDSDGDGIPDEWEQWIVNNTSNPAIQGVADVTGSQDEDGDGFSNMQEYIAGTIPTLDYDYFFADQLDEVVNGRLVLQFLSVPGKKYKLLGSSNLASGTWENATYSLSPEGTPQTGPFEGNGNWLSVYLIPDHNALVYSLTVE